MIEQTQRFGSSLSKALRTHADMMRARREQRAEEQANRAAVKILIPTLLFIFPAIFVVMAGPAAIQIYEKLTQPKAAAHSGQ
jgi:tight adherence protein C